MAFSEEWKRFGRRKSASSMFKKQKTQKKRRELCRTMKNVQIKEKEREQKIEAL